MKKLVALVLAAVLALSCVACGKTETTATTSTETAETAKTEEVITSETGSGVVVETEQEDDEVSELIAAHTLEDGRTFINVAVEADPGTLSPFGSGVGKIQHVIRNALFETAMVFLSDGTLQPYLATGYDQIDDVTYDIYFKDYVYDTEGNHLTASDVVFSWLCGRDEWNHGNMAFIADAEAIDEYTVRLTMTAAQTGTFEKILYEGWIFTQAAYEASPDQFVTTPVGTSNYRLVSWETGSEITIEKTGNYWETDDSKKTLIQQANVDVITYKIIPEEAQRVIALQTGEVDLIHKVDANNLSTFSGDDYLQFATMNNQVVTMMFNCSEKSPCGDVRVRQAICYALDAAGIIDITCGGEGTPVSGLFTSGSADAYDSMKESEWYAYDADKAVELLAEAGYSTSNPVTITCMYETTDKNAITAEAIQSYLGLVGINVEMYPCEGATYSTYKLTSDNWDFHLGACGGLEPYCIGSWWSYRGTGADDSGNVIALDDAHQTELLEAAYAAATHDEEHMKAAYDYMRENAFIYPLYIYNLFTVTSPIFKVMNLRCGGREIAPQYCEYIWNN